MYLEQKGDKDREVAVIHNIAHGVINKATNVLGKLAELIFATAENVWERPAVYGQYEEAWISSTLGRRTCQLRSRKLGWVEIYYWSFW